MEGHPHYKRLVRVLNFLAENWQSQPNLEKLADIAALSPDHFQRIFTQWVGISPKNLLAVLTHEQVVQSLKLGKPLLDIAYEHGLSSPSRLHDLFIKIETMNPGQYKSLGQGMKFYYGFFETDFGLALMVANQNNALVALVFTDDELAGDRTQDRAYQEVKARWEQSIFIEDNNRLLPIYQQIFAKIKASPDQPLSVVLKGTDFQLKVWQALMAIPASALTSYMKIGESLGYDRPAGQAIGQAVGQNPISWLIPCHRVLAKDGLLNGYRWGLERKYGMLAHELAGNGLCLHSLP